MTLLLLVGNESTDLIKGCAPLGRRILDQKSKDYRHETATKIFFTAYSQTRMY